MSGDKGTVTATHLGLVATDDFYRCCCGGRYAYCFFDPGWKDKVPFIDGRTYKIEIVRRIVRKEVRQ